MNWIVVAVLERSRLKENRCRFLSYSDTR